MYGDPPEKNELGFRLSRSLTVIGTDKDRLTTYDFLLMIHINHKLIWFPR